METGFQNINYFGSYDLVVRFRASWNGYEREHSWETFDRQCEEYFNAAVP